MVSMLSEGTEITVRPWSVDDAGARGRTWIADQDYLATGWLSPGHGGPRDLVLPLEDYVSFIESMLDNTVSFGFAVLADEVLCGGVDLGLDLLWGDEHAAVSAWVASAFAGLGICTLPWRS